MGGKISKSKLINDYLTKISDEYITEKEIERNRLNTILNLAYINNESNIKNDLKSKYLKEISKMKNQTVTELETFFLVSNYNFGNGLIAINNVIFICEIVGCHKIILNKEQKGRKWLIVNPIYIENTNITIIQGSNVDCEKKDIVCIYRIAQIYYYMVAIPKLRISLMKSEILKNLPKVDINKGDLYIHMRGGDIFIADPPHHGYAQPPLCFYEKVINNSFFKNIYIIAMDNSNIIINTLIQKYNNVIHKINSIEYDISILCHAYNLIASISSFCLSALKLNDNLKDLWEYDLMRLYDKFLNLHHHTSQFEIKYIIHTMKPSDKYLSKMFYWKKSPEQLKLMLEDNCPYDFQITKPNI